LGEMSSSVTSTIKCSAIDASAITLKPWAKGNRFGMRRADVHTTETESKKLYVSTPIASGVTVKMFDNADKDMSPACILYLTLSDDDEDLSTLKASLSSGGSVYDRIVSEALRLSKALFDKANMKQSTMEANMTPMVTESDMYDPVLKAGIPFTTDSSGAYCATETVFTDVDGSPLTLDELLKITTDNVITARVIFLFSHVWVQTTRKFGCKVFVARVALQSKRPRHAKTTRQEGGEEKKGAGGLEAAAALVFA